jgi:hypothetical protein
MKFVQTASARWESAEWLPIKLKSSEAKAYWLHNRAVSDQASTGLNLAGPVIVR